MGIEDYSKASTMVVHKNNTRPTPFTPSTNSSSHLYNHYNTTKHRVDVC